MNKLVNFAFILFLLIGIFQAPISANEANNDNNIYPIVNGRKWTYMIKYLQSSKYLKTAYDDYKKGIFNFCYLGIRTEGYDAVIWEDGKKEQFREIVIPEGFKEIRGIGCVYKDLKKVTLPKGLKKIDSHAFSDCESLETINIPNGVTEIGAHAFKDCTSLVSITIPDSVTKIGVGAFKGCKKLKSIILSNNIKRISKDLFYNCTSLEKVNIPDGITEIAAGAFHDCVSLKKVHIPNSVTTIGMSAFAYCGFEKITIPNSVKVIEIDWRYSTYENDRYMEPFYRTDTIYYNGTAKGKPWGARIVLRY